MNRQLHFTITGEFITNFARERYKETSDVSNGVDFLCKSLNGFPKDIATEVILGRKKLVGRDEVSLEDDCAEVTPYGVIRPSDIEKVVCGWVSPDGLVFGHESHNNQNDHRVLAEEIVKRFKYEGTDYEWCLEKHGFLKFDPYKVIAGDTPATAKQKEAISKLCKSHKSKLQIGWQDHVLYSGSQIDEMDMYCFNKHLNRVHR